MSKSNLDYKNELLSKFLENEKEENKKKIQLTSEVDLKSISLTTPVGAKKLSKPLIEEKVYNQQNQVVNSHQDNTDENFYGHIDSKSSKFKIDKKLNYNLVFVLIFIVFSLLTFIALSVWKG